jgi:hypothetical protein
LLEKLPASIDHERLASTAPTMSPLTAARFSAPRVTPYSAALSMSPRLAPVSVRPGAIALTVTLSSPSSRASARVMAMIAPFEET